MKASYKTTPRIKPLASSVRAASRLWLSLIVGSAALVAGCSEESATTTTAATEAPAAPAVSTTPPKPVLGIRPQGDEEVAIDMSMIYSDELKSIFSHIDANLDEHVINLQKWIQQPSISNTGEGIQ